MIPLRSPTILRDPYSFIMHDIQKLIFPLLLKQDHYRFPYVQNAKKQQKQYGLYIVTPNTASRSPRPRAVQPRTQALVRGPRALKVGRAQST